MDAGKGRDCSSAAGYALKRIARSAIVEHSGDALYALIEDIEAYPQFLPWCLGARIHERAPGRTVATLTVGIKGVRQAFTTENINRPGESIDMRLIEGPFKRFAAAWRLKPLGANATRIEFTLEYQFASRVLARLLEPLFSHIADTMVTSFGRRADALHAKASAR
jgi:ribosome-associated toxin RatA of RatAB toxin-antitoxin module